ncbi:DNA-directed RNA polymerase specialized sigma subunit sigma24-like protein [Paramagnetospirillum magnetotacticum MS-1]|uniref:DNA-directed RNA polymerase specialized sigma subunit sigma24-like protein n=1 Tax=Paramagnetospirillum magnetotacticum MS-1 TaxID=272627 RepID=A0A0C2Z019_PARME|nr:sigma-70 family RNA polymerase sigma factor [Paramagnetospirillum magnetotacticum]KIM00689.1 DNA-directed RNA polymerase specialized sigma subunit sigma24-like protein [Paramagnetospirillum magnetotacticum MS-1]
MAEGQSPALVQFLAQRPRLRLLAYRLLGSTADAEDVVQDAWLKWNLVADSVEEPAAFLTTQVTRLAIDRLRKDQRRARLGAQWLPDPWVEMVEPGEADLSTGLLLLLERLTPDQRAVYVLREAMDLDFADIAATLGKSVATCRQIMSRARAALKGEVRFDWDAAQTATLVRRFAAACDQRDYGALVSLLGTESRLISDGGAKVKSARNPILGPDRIARFLLGVRRKFQPADFTFRMAEVNGLPALVGEAQGTARWVLTFGCAQGRIGGVYLLADPDRLPYSTISSSV